MKVYISIVLAFLSSSCGTMKTIDPIYNQVGISHQGHKSYCKNIPRVYSGMAYNFCLLYGEPNSNGTVSSVNGVPVFLIDSLFSLATDTVVLPYTIYTQAKEGNIKVN